MPPSGLGRLFVALEGSWASLLTVYLLQLETQLHHLSSTHREASSENQRLRETERDLTGQLEEVQEQLQVTREQLQVTRGHLNVAKGRVSWQMEEEPRQVAAIPVLW